MIKMEKNYRVDYYLYDLTELISKSFYTPFGALVYAYWIAYVKGFKTYIYGMDYYEHI